MTKVIAVTNQKGGIGKTTITKNLGFALARQDQKVLLIDFDPQHNLTTGMGFKATAKLPITVTSIVSKMMNHMPFDASEGILSHSEGIDLMPANRELSGLGGGAC